MENSEKKIFAKEFEHPDERREFSGHGHLDVLNFEDGTVIGRGVFEPGWKWSTDVKPIAETPSCQASHSGYCLKGEMIIQMDSGETFPIKAGEAFRIPPGHDAWVVGTETCEMLDVSGYTEYALKKEPAKKTA